MSGFHDYYLSGPVRTLQTVDEFCRWIEGCPELAGIDVLDKKESTVSLQGYNKICVLVVRPPFITIKEVFYSFHHQQNKPREDIFRHIIVANTPAGNRVKIVVEKIIAGFNDQEIADISCNRRSVWYIDEKELLKTQWKV